jgi:hypothetical protein
MKPPSINNRTLQRVLFAGLLCGLLPSSEVLAQNPVVRVDLNFNGRNEGEVHEPGYFPWAVGAGKSESRTFEGIKVELKGTFTSDWYKAGVQAPSYAKWVNDGLVSDGPVELVISGLPDGNHSLLTVHNTFEKLENNTSAPLDIYVDGKLVTDNLVPSNRAEHTIRSQMAYLSLNAKSGKAVVVRFEVDPRSNASIKRVVLNGFEINTADIKKQARMPVPIDGDEHVDLGKTMQLKWSPAPNIVSHEVYFGANKKAVAAADHSSPEYKGNHSGTSFQVENLYSMNTYYWRVDEKGADGKLVKGNVWYFRPAQLAFPGAEGYGRFARGGRGGKVVHVTNLNDSGPGSLREAVSNDIGPRTIVFDVSGIIKLKDRMVINQPYVTLAGQTAPGKGITIAGAPLGLTGNDGVVRFVRVRVGAGRTFDGMGLTGANHSIIDHSSISWTIDEAFSSRGAHNISLQRTLISEALNIADHGKYEKGKMHGYGATIGGDIGSFHHNLLAHNYGRNWSLGGGVDGNGYYTGRLDIRNNVVYNWGQRTTDGGANEVNFVNNYYKPGAATSVFHALKAQHETYGGGKQQYYFAGNVMPGYFDESSQEKGRAIQGKVAYETYINTPFFPSHVTTHSAKEAYKNVLSDVGSNQPVFDDHDIRIVEETLAGTYKYKGSKSGLPGMLDTHQDAGGLENYPVQQREAGWDTDRDGLPDWWEKAHSLNPNSRSGDFSDSNADSDKDGFTNLDLYLDWMANPHYFLTTGEALDINLKQLFRGFTASPSYRVLNVENGKADLNGEGTIAQFSSGKPGLAHMTVSVSDNDGSSMNRKVGVYIADKK